MSVTRRLYVYLICGVSLTILAVALRHLLDLGLIQALERAGVLSAAPDDGTSVRRDVSLNLALLVVATPIWLLHWYLAERWSASASPASDRGSGIRAVYFAGVLGATAVVFMIELYRAISEALSLLLGVSTSTTGREMVPTFTISSVALAVWGYHAWVRHRDTQRREMSGSGVWPVRVYVYAIALAGALLVVTGIVQLIGLGIDAIVDWRADPVVTSDQAPALVSALTRLLLGAGIWSIHWVYSLRVLGAQDWRARSEQPSLLRWSYLYTNVILGVAVTLIAISISLTTLFRWALGVERATGAAQLWAEIMDPSAFAIPFMLLWLYHRRVIDDESEQLADRPAQQSASRIYAYCVALIALGFAAVGIGYITGIAIGFLFDIIRIMAAEPEWRPDEVSAFLSISLVGGSVWWWYWSIAQRRVTANPEEERSTTARRVYLYLTLTAATLTVLGTLAYLLYQALQLLLGVRETTGLAQDVAGLLGVLLVAGAILTYHLLALRDDVRFEQVDIEVGADTAETLAASLEPRTLTLLLTGPASENLEAVANQLSTMLPRGFELRLSQASGASQHEISGPARDASQSDAPDNRPSCD